VIKDPLAEAVHVGEAMRGRQIDPGLPFLGAPIVEAFRRDSDLHNILLLIPILSTSRGGS
jgi:hypothetical protein